MLEFPVYVIICRVQLSMYNATMISMQVLEKRCELVRCALGKSPFQATSLFCDSQAFAMSSTQCISFFLFRQDKLHFLKRLVWLSRPLPFCMLMRPCW